MGFEIVGDIVKKNKWENDDPRAIALHGLIGGIMAEINGGKFGDGLTTATLNKILIDQLVDLRDDQRKFVFSGDELRWFSAILGGLIAGNEGAKIADSATLNNALEERKFLPPRVPFYKDPKPIAVAYDEVHQIYDQYYPSNGTKEEQNYYDYVFNNILKNMDYATLQNGGNVQLALDAGLIKNGFFRNENDSWEPFCKIDNVRQYSTAGGGGIIDASVTYIYDSDGNIAEHRMGVGVSVKGTAGSVYFTEGEVIPLSQLGLPSHLRTLSTTQVANALEGLSIGGSIGAGKYVSVYVGYNEQLGVVLFVNKGVGVGAGIGISDILPWY